MWLQSWWKDQQERVDYDPFSLVKARLRGLKLSLENHCMHVFRSWRLQKYRESDGIPKMVATIPKVHCRFQIISAPGREQDKKFSSHCGCWCYSARHFIIITFSVHYVGDDKQTLDASMTFHLDSYLWYLHSFQTTTAFFLLLPTNQCRRRFLSTRKINAANQKKEF